MRPPFGLFTMALNAWLILGASAAEVSRTPPPVYAGQLAAQLTPLPDVLPGRTAFPDTKSGGLNLLSEKIVYRGPDGVTYRLSHVVYHALDQSGVETVGTDTFSYDRLREDIFLVDAATILPNGSRLTVEPAGAFIQTPQREADNALYTSRAELRVVYPNVAPGTTTEAIVLIRENTPVMPGEFALTTPYGASWPTFRDRLVLDFPADALTRIHVVTTGSGVPEPTSAAYAPGRERRTWERERLRAVDWEENGPRWEFRGPTLWLTTLDSWDGLTGWYQALVSDRSSLGPPLEAEVDTLTAGLTDRRAIIDRLTAAVATDVRYVGLEFGLAGYQPRPGREVWEKRYGDCKDKANLLRAMLAHKGIDAHLVLLDTHGLGLIEHAAPSWLQFNHVILAVENGADGYLFCDPTVERLPAGTLGLSDFSRDVLLVKAGRAEWVRTPDLLASSIRIRADLALAANGGLSGWFTLGGTGSDAAYYASYFSGLDRDERLRKMQEYVAAFFPGAEAIDLDYTPPEKTVREFGIRTYFLRAPRAAGEQVITFPYPTSWLPSTNTPGERRFPYTTSRREENVSATIALPDHWSVRTVPAAFAAGSDFAKFSAAWTVSPGKLEAQLSWYPEHAVLAPADYAVFQRSVRAFAGWLEQPVVLSFAKDAAGAVLPAAGATADPGDFPVLATGAGQLRLLEEKYPEGQDNPRRRAALQRVLQWFPQDTETVFTAQVQLALLDQPHDGDKAFADRTRALLVRHGPQVGAGLRAWGEFLEAKARWVSEHRPDAIQHLRQIADDASLSAYRRGWSAEAAGRYLRESNPAAARDFLRKHIAYESEARESIVRLIGATYATAGDAAGWRDWAVALAQDQPAVADALLAAALAESGDDPIPTATRADLVRLLREPLGDAAKFPHVAGELQKLETLNATARARETYRQALAAWLEQHPPAWWTPKKSPKFADRDAVIKFIKASNDAENAEAAVDGALQLVLYHEPAFADLAIYSRWALWWLDHRKLDPELFLAWSRLTLRLPATHEDVIDCWNLLGAHCARQGELAEARAVYRQVLADPAAAKYQRVGANGELGLMELRAGNIDAALAAFHPIQPIQTAHKWSADYLYVAVLLHLDRGEPEAALELLESIRQQEQQYLDKCEHHVALGHLLRAALHPDALKHYWQLQPGFRDAWNAILATQGLPPADRSAPPLPTDYTAAADRSAKALAAKDAKAFLRELDVTARLAQWIPLFASDLATYASQTAPFGGDLQRSLYTCELRLISDLEPVDPQFDASARLWEVALLGDLGQRAEACAKARRAIKEIGPDQPVGEHLLRVWAMFARKTAEEEEVTGLLAAELAGQRQLANRLSSLRTLSDSYELSGRTTANRMLLERETARPDFDAKSADGRTLLARLNLLRTSGESAQAFTREVKAWMSRRDLGWLDHVAPSSLDDPRFATTKPPVLQDPPGISTAETIKFNLLAALDESLPTDIRGQSLYAAAFDLAFGADDVRELAATLAEAAAIETLPAEPRASCVVVALNSLLRLGRTSLAADVAAQPAFQVINADLQADYARAHRALVRADAGGEDWEKPAFAILAEKPLERFSIAVAERLVRELAWRGEFGRADLVIANGKDLAIAPSLRQTSSALRLEWTRLVRTIRDHRELLGQLRTQVAALPEAATAPTPRVLHRMALNHPEGLTEVERVTLAAHTLATGDFLPEGTRQLLWLPGASSPFTAAHPMFQPDLLETALHSTAPDTVKASFVAVAALASDVDRPEVLARVSRLLEEFMRSSAAASLPQTQQAVAMARALHALRTSHEKKPEALFGPDQTASLPPSFRTAFQLRFHHARGHLAEALDLVQSLGADQLSQPEVFPVARAILLGAGRAAEADLLDESMRAVVQQKMPAFWYQPETAGSENWFEIVETLGPPHPFDAAWFARALARSTATPRQATLQLRQAWLAQDWTAANDAADRVLGETPDVYDTYYSRAVIRHHLHHDTGACADLRVFLTHSLSSENYPAAVKLFRDLAPGERIELPE